MSATQAGNASPPAGQDGVFANTARRRAVPWICLLLAAMVWLVYGRTLGNGFVNYDDNMYVYENPVVTAGLSLHGVAWAFSYDDIGHWHPVTWLSHMLDCDLYGLQPWGHHLTNVLLHAAAAILLFLVLGRMTGTLWRSAFVAAVFAIHPQHVESVAWVAERKDVLSGLFFMLTLGAYTRYAQQPASRARYCAVIALFAMGLMCKGMLVTLPFVLLLLDYWPLRRLRLETIDGKSISPQDMRASISRLAVEKIPLFALSIISCVITSLAPEEGLELSVYSRIGNALMSYVIYLRQMVYPAGLAIPYPFPRDGWSAPEVALALAILAVITALAVVFGRKRSYLIVGWLWYLGMLVPVIGFVQISYYARADRYTYLPEIGLYIAVAWLAADLCVRMRHGRLVMGCVSAVILLPLMFAARMQASYWKDGQTLWEHAFSVTEDNAIAHLNFGSGLQEKGQLDQAIAQYNMAVEINPRYVKALSNLGTALQQKGQVDDAIAEYKKALEIAPGYAEAHSNLGYALHRNGQVDDAIAEYKKALEISPDIVETLLNLGIAYSQKGELKEALAQFQKAAEINPGSAKAQNDIGLALLQSGEADEAIAHFHRALEIEPGFADASYNLDLALQRKEK